MDKNIKTTEKAGPRYTPKQWESYLNDLERHQSSTNNEDEVRQYMQKFCDENNTSLSNWLEAYHTTLSDDFFFYQLCYGKEKKNQALALKVQSYGNNCQSY